MKGIAGHHAFRTAIETVFAHKLRSSLSILGIAFGVATLVATVCIGEGTRQQVLQAIESMGTNLLILKPTRDVRAGTLSMADVDAVSKRKDIVSRAVPVTEHISVASSPAGEQVVFVDGTMPGYEIIRNYRVARGRFISIGDVEKKNMVCVLGSEAARKLFPISDPLEKIVGIGEGAFTVIGVLERKGYGFNMDNDKRVIIPIGSIRNVLGKDKNITAVLIQSVDSRVAADAAQEIAALMEKLHGSSGAFTVWSQEELLKKKRWATAVFKIALGSIAVVSLIVGGIGIMNVQLISVGERVREIGIRKAIGATGSNILWQFILESVIMSVAGGIAGVVGGVFLGNRAAYFLSRLVPEGSGWAAVVTWQPLVLGLVFAVTAGVACGIYPARKAARLDPCSAIRYEPM